MDPNAQNPQPAADPMGMPAVGGVTPPPAAEPTMPAPAAPAEPVAPVVPEPAPVEPAPAAPVVETPAAVTGDMSGQGGSTPPPAMPPAA